MTRRICRFTCAALYNLCVGTVGVSLLTALGGEAGCRRLSSEFYGRVATDPVLRPLFPGRSLRCAIEEFAGFLIQFLGGDEEQTQYRSWLSLRESHSRFAIGANQRGAWLRNMEAALEAVPLDNSSRGALRRFFVHSSAHITGKTSDAELRHEELTARWSEQLVLDEVIAAIASGRDRDALTWAARFAARPSVFVGVLARMMQSGRAALVSFVVNAVEKEAGLGTRRYNGRTLLHFASGAGCAEVVALLLRAGMHPDIPDHGGHTPLYQVANECSSEAGPLVVRALVRAGADVNAQTGVTGATALHMAARRGHVEIARALLEYGADLDRRDRKGDTALRRARNCRKNGVARLLEEHRSALRGQ